MGAKSLHSLPPSPAFDLEGVLRCLRSAPLRGVDLIRRTDRGRAHTRVGRRGGNGHVQMDPNGHGIYIDMNTYGLRG